MVDEDPKKETVEEKPAVLEVEKKENPVVKAAREEREKMEKLLEEMKAEREGIDNAKAEMELSGHTEAAARKPKAEPLTNIEYAKKLQMGEVNPLGEDGFE